MPNRDALVLSATDELDSLIDSQLLIDALYDKLQNCNEVGKMTPLGEFVHETLWLLELYRDLSVAENLRRVRGMLVLYQSVE